MFVTGGNAGFVIQMGIENCTQEGDYHYSHRLLQAR